LRIGKDFVERASRRLHLGENEIAGAIDDPAHGGNRIGDQPLPQRFDHGNASGNRRFEFKGDVPILRERGQTGAMMG
jgi:hypothetical protein